MFIKYFKISTKSEKIFDIILPLFIAVGVVIPIHCLMDVKLLDFIKNFISINSIVLSSIAILVGFNIASVAVIAGSQSELVQKLKTVKSETDKDETVFSVLIIFFTWSILIQLLVILVGILGFLIAQFNLNKSLSNIITPWYIFVLFGIWVFLIIHSVFVSFRNTKMLYLFVTYK